MHLLVALAMMQYKFQLVSLPGGGKEPALSGVAAGAAIASGLVGEDVHA